MQVAENRAETTAVAEQDEHDEEVEHAHEHGLHMEHLPPEPGQKKLRVQWYRSPVPREQLSELNKRSDFKGFLQTLGYLGLLALNGALSIYSAYHWPWYVTVALVFFHGTCWHFMINGFHELVHDSVFKTRWLNGFFLRVLSFLGWYNHHAFWASHTEHHKYTLHPPDDLEVVLPIKYTLPDFLSRAIFSPKGFYYTLKYFVRLSLGRVEGKWETHLFPASDPAKRRRLFNWARIVLLGQAAIVGVSIYMKWWMVPVVITLAPFYAAWLHYLCNGTQHVGLKDHVSDFRLCCRTIRLNWFVQFLYWHMNYHTEHHMYAAVPCYNLGKLHKLIKDDLPYCPNGLADTWYQVIGILWRQKQEPGYQYEPVLPPAAKRASAPSTSAATATTN